MLGCAASKFLPVIFHGDLTPMHSDNVLAEQQPAIAGVKKWGGLLFEFLLIVFILIGVIFRFSWVNWSQGTNLHPDEYGLTNTLTHLQLPESAAGYFNTRLSSISPYPRYDEGGSQVGDGPDHRMRWGQWPMIIIRAAAEATGNTGYDELRLMGRSLSALVDTLALVFIFLIGQRLYNRKTGLLAAALSALAVMQIQQSHFMTVDNFGTMFAAAAMYACVLIAHNPPARRLLDRTAEDHDALPIYRLDRRAGVFYLLFGVFFGMAMASKINLLPLGGMALIALFISIADLKLRTTGDLRRIALIAAAHLALIGVVSLVTFRLTQPMSFRQPTGNTAFFTTHLNQDWVESMEVAKNESSGVGGGPPAEQWAHRPAIIFPLVNMVVWGMGLPLGAAAWLSLLWVAWRFIRKGENWRAHLLPLVWTGGYFLFMGTRWVKSIRYFLPIYPFLCLFAAWGLLALWRWALDARSRRDADGKTDQQNVYYRPVRTAFSGLAMVVVLGGTLAWANAFTGAVYRQDHTRIQATKWILRNVPSLFHLTLETSDGSIHHQPVAGPDWLQVSSLPGYETSFQPAVSGELVSVTIPHATLLEPGAPAGWLWIRIASDPDGLNVLDEVLVTVEDHGEDQPGPAVSGEFQKAHITAGETYYLVAVSQGSETIAVSRMVVSSESWDEGLPVRLEGWDPYGQLYRGAQMEVRWHDDENKRDMFLDTLAQADYVILPSQRGIWSTCRLPRTYPMTMAYYRALFDGSLGFEKAALFQSPFRIGPLAISDVGGTAAWGGEPQLPLFNNNLLAAEEAFSVYDHPPVWLFKKRSDFDIEAAREVLYSVDLSTVVVQSPRDATGELCP